MTVASSAMLVGVIFVLAAFLLRFVPKGKER